MLKCTNQCFRDTKLGELTSEERTCLTNCFGKMTLFHTYFYTKAEQFQNELARKTPTPEAFKEKIEQMKQNKQ